MQAILYHLGLPKELCDIVRSYAFHSDATREKWARNLYKYVLRDLEAVDYARHIRFYNEIEGGAKDDYLIYELMSDYDPGNIKPSNVKARTKRRIEYIYRMYDYNEELLIDIENFEFKRDEESDDE